MNHRSLAFRLAVWYALLLSAAFALLATGTYFALQHFLRATLHDSLRRRSEQIEQFLGSAPPSVDAAAIAEAIATRIAPEFNNRFVRVTRAPGTILYHSGQPADRSFDATRVAPPPQPWPTEHVVRRVHAARGAMLLSQTPILAASGAYLIEVGASLQPVQAVQDHLLTSLGWLLPMLVVCAAAGGYLLVNWALRPVERLAQTAERISVEDLDARLPVMPTGDALQRLSISLNHMLARLHDSMQTSRRFLADASHELRTPLTVLKGELQEISGSAEGTSTVRERIGSALEEVARLERLVSGLLALSRLDAGDAQREWIDVDLGALAASTVEQMRLVAEDRGVRLDASELRPLIVRGDRGRLRQVIVNLLDNAIKFTPRGGSVRLRDTRQEGACVLEVSDTGIGIPPEAIGRVFDRFYRVDEARARESEATGAGLGLSIVRSICSAHGAEIVLESTLGQGSRFLLKFPPAPAHGAAGGIEPVTPVSLQSGDH